MNTDIHTHTHVYTPILSGFFVYVCVCVCVRVCVDTPGRKESRGDWCVYVGTCAYVCVYERGSVCGVYVLGTCVSRCVCTGVRVCVYTPGRTRTQAHRSPRDSFLPGVSTQTPYTHTRTHAHTDPLWILFYPECQPKDACLRSTLL